MIDALDHIAIAVADLDVAATAYEALLGRAPDWREEAAGARHAWFQLGNMALDLVQPDGPGESGDRVRARLASAGEGLWGLAFATADFEETRRTLERRGAPSSEPLSLLSTDSWRLSFLDPTSSHGIAIALAERGAEPKRQADVDKGAIHALDHAVVNTANADRAAALYGARLGLVGGADDDHARTSRLARLVQKGPGGEKRAAGLQRILMSQMFGMNRAPLLGGGGGLREDDPELLAQMVARLAHGFSSPAWRR